MGQCWLNEDPHGLRVFLCADLNSKNLDQQHWSRVRVATPFCALQQQNLTIAAVLHEQTSAASSPNPDL